MGNSPSSPGQPDTGSTTTSSGSGSSGKNSSTAASKQAALASGSGTGNTSAVSGPARGSHSNIPISPSLAQQQQQQQQQHHLQQQQQQQPRPASSPFIPPAQPRPPPPGVPPQARAQQQQRPVSQYVPTPYLQHLQNRPNQPRPQQPTPQRPPQPIPHQAPHQPDAAAEDEIPTIVLQEQMESMLIDIATTESRVRELREELDTFESHPIFSSMMLAWFLSFNPGDYSIHRLEDLKRDALKAWQPVLSTFVQDSSGSGAQGQHLTEIEVQLFGSIIQDVISHANMIAGSTLDPEQLIQNLIQVAHSELEKARRTLEENRNAFQECQLMLQSRGVIPTSVLEMQRQIEDEQKREQEARKANEQRQKEVIAQKQREHQRKRELEEQERQREREQEERRLLELEDQRKQEALRKAHEEEQEQQKKLEALRIKQEQLWKRMEAKARPARPYSSSIAVASASHTAKASSVSSPISLPAYNSAFAKRVHPESSAAFGVNITEEETLVTDPDPYEVHFVAPAMNAVEQNDEELLGTPLLRRQKPVSSISETSSAEPAAAAHQLSYPPPSPSAASRMAHTMQMPMPMPFIPDYKQHQFAASLDHTQGQGQGTMQTQDVPRSIPEHVPALYPPQIISEQDLQERLAQEQLEKIKRQNQEMERKIFLGQEQQRLHALTIQSIEMQGGVVPQGYPPYSHMGAVGASHEPAQEEYRDHTQSMHSQQSSHGSYSPYGQQQGFVQQQQHPGVQHQLQQQQGYQAYPPDPSSGQYDGAMGNGQEQASNRGDMYNYQSYGGYNNQTGPNWGPQHQQHQAGYLHHQQQQQQQQQQHYGYSSGMGLTQQQHLQQHYQQQQQQQQHQHHQQFQQHLSPGQQTANGYGMPHSHGNVTYSVSPYGQEYDFGPAPMADSATGEAVVSAATADAEVTAEDANTVDGTLAENDTRSPEVLPQIRANPVIVPIKRGPQAILSDEQREAAAQALKDAEEDIQETDALAISSQPCASNPEAEAEAEFEAETDLGADNSGEGQEDAPISAHSARSLDKELPPTPLANGDVMQNEGEKDDTKAKEEGEESEETRLEKEQEDEEEEEKEEEEEEEVLQRSVRKMRIRSTTPTPPTISAPAASSVSPQPQLGNRVGPVFAPFPPRAAPRPAPRPIHTEAFIAGNGVERSGAAASGQSTLAASSQGVDSSAETMSTATPAPRLPKSSASTESIRRLSMLKRTPSVPPVIPKKPAALRSPRSPTSDEQTATDSQ
ncbi:hypothetical protein BGZ67_001342 [Mortierella alpina]|nr:hypothetical protein BGZ67_001342 [Mortierella alpina]